jgi:hypothetical protein
LKIIGNYRRIRKGKKYMSKKQAMNPYLPLWEYVPDGEPRVFGDRLYVYGSHERPRRFRWRLWYGRKGTKQF